MENLTHKFYGGKAAYSLKKLCGIVIKQQNLDSSTLPFALQRYIEQDIRQCCTYKIADCRVYILLEQRPELFALRANNSMAKPSQNYYVFDCVIRSSAAMEGLMSIPACLGHIDCMWKMKAHGFEFEYNKKINIRGQDSCCPFRFYYFDCIKFLIDHDQIAFQYVVAENIKTIPLSELQYIVTKCDFKADAVSYVLKRAVNNRPDVVNFLHSLAPKRN